MKRFNVLNVLVLILLLYITGCSQSQDQNKTEETADDLLIKFIEYFDKEGAHNAIDCLQKAVELDSTKRIYFEIIGYIVDRKFAEALKLLEERKDKSPVEKERKVIQILEGETHYLWAEELKKEYDYINAITHYEAAYGIDIIYRRKQSAVDLINIGFLYAVLGQKQKALGYYEKALPISHEVGDRFGKAFTLNNTGSVYYSLGMKQKALVYYEKAITIFHELGDHSREANTLYNIGRVYSDLGQKQKALEYYERALPILREVRNRSVEATTLNNIGVVYSTLGQNRKALEYYEKALPILREAGDRSVEATTLNNIGSLYSTFSQNRKALEYYEKALPILCEVGNRSGEATTLNNIGLVYSNLDQNQKALEYYEKALLIRREVGDRSGEATTLNNIGKVYSDLGQNKKALEYFEKALPILREVGNRSVEAINLNNIGGIYSAFGQKNKALVYYEKALPILREVGGRSREAVTLNNIGDVYSDLGKKQKALEYFEKALPIFCEVGDRSGEATTLNNIGGVYSDLGQKQRALEYYNKALPIRRRVRDRSGEATTLNNIGLVYSDLGQKQRALEYYEKALIIYKSVGDRSGEATTLNNIGGVYSDLGQNRKALEYYENILSIDREVGDRSGEATTLNNIGGVYSALDQKNKALEYYKKALLTRRKVRDRSGVATTLNNIGMVYYSLGQKQKTLEYLEKVLSILVEIGDKAIEAVLLSNLMVTWNEMNKNSLAIFYGKQAVNMLQNLRQNIDNLDTKTKLKYLLIKKNYYRVLASLMIDSGRIAEAQQVLDILKDEEYFSFVLQNRSAYSPQYAPIDYTGFERKWINRQNTIVKKISSISRPYYELFIKKAKTPEEEKKLEALKRELDNTREGYRDFLKRMKKEFETHKYKEDSDIDTTKKQAGDLKEYLNSLNQINEGKTAALHFLVYKGRISMIITTPTSQTVKHSPPFNEKEFSLMIYNYRDLIEKLARLSRIANPLSTAASKIAELSRQKRDIENKLYNLIFKPVHQYLKQYGPVNLLVSLDGVLRYIPLTSLWDGEHYLVQQYRFVLLNPSSIKLIDEIPAIENKILGMGASKGGKGFKPLPHASQEIHAIVHDREKGCTGLITGNALIDNDFTRETMINRLKTTSYPFVHIASHFKFSPGNETNNRLLLGDGTFISLSDIRKEGNLFDRVKLLVLSACQTGMGGNGEEIDGFGRLAQQCGAESVIASLWSVDDESTKELMVKFYCIMEEEKVTSKIEALRLAQLELAGLEDLIDKSKGAVSAASARKKDYSNPYYWAPFIMMGDWR